MDIPQIITDDDFWCYKTHHYQTVTYEYAPAHCPVGHHPWLLDVISSEGGQVVWFVRPNPSDWDSFTPKADYAFNERASLESAASHVWGQHQKV